KPAQRLFAKLTFQALEHRIFGPAENLAIGCKIAGVLINQISECGLGASPPTDRIFTLVDPAFGFASPGVCVRLHDKGLAKNVSFTSYLSSPLASRPPVNGRHVFPPASRLEHHAFP